MITRLSIVAALTFALTLSSSAAVAAKPTRPDASAAAAGSSSNEGKSQKKSQSIGDPLFPQVGNRGYDVKHYDIALDYDPTANAFNPGTETTITAKAKKSLSRFSLDFQDLDVSAVEVNGRPAEFTQKEATPDLSDIPEVTQPMKLIVTPHKRATPRGNKSFEVEVSYSGQPEEITDPDESIEGWIQACFPLTPPQTCDGAFVVNEPNGAQSWFPANNYPTDKARFDTKITVPAAKTALGVGELASREDNGDGTSTWHWSEDDPTATYLTTATVGDFDYTVTELTESSTGRTLPVYNAIDSTATQAQKDAINASLSRAEEQLNFLSDELGPYPFDSHGAVADKAAGVGYALEVQTKPHYAGSFSTGNPSININTQLHEISHMWMGNSVSPASWHEIWFNEGWATWLTWHWAFEANGSPTSPADQFDDIYNNPDFDWEIAPAILDNDPANLFHGDPVYDRPAAMLEGYRQIVGDDRFFDFARALLSKYGYGNVSIDEFIKLAKQISGFKGKQRKRLDAYFQEWLYLEGKPTILPSDF
jgi:aminopeptidase N